MMGRKLASKKELAKQGKAALWIRRGCVAYPDGSPPQQHPEAEWWWTGWRMKEAEIKLGGNAIPPSGKIEMGDELDKAYRAIPKPPKRYKRKEAAILKKCIGVLAHYKIFAWRNSVGSFQLGTGRYIRFGSPGMSDIIGAMPTGRFLAVEVKKPGAYQTPMQKKFEARVKASNGIYWVVRSAEELEQNLKEYLAQFLKDI